MQDFSQEATKTGTTTCGIVCKDGVVMAAERRATMGTLIAHKVTRKVMKIDENLAMTTAGLVGDLQLLTRYLTAEVELYRMKRGVAMPVEAAATLMANILVNRRFAPYLVQLIIGGWDSKGGHVFSIDLAGGSIEDKWTSTGSGSPYVFGVLEDHYREDIVIDEGVDLAIRGVTAAMKRDAASGDGIDAVTIGPRGFTDVGDKEIERRKTKMKLT